MVLIIRYTCIAILTAAALLFLAPAACAAAQPSAGAAACVVLSEDGGCLFAQNADERLLIASTTKLMTAAVTLENAALDETVRIPSDGYAVEGSSMYLSGGESYTVRELLLGLLLASGNDAALALADYVGGSEAGFVRMMNEKAAALGLTNTHFENPHGLDAPGHYSSARDLARLMLQCMESDVFRELCSTRSAEVKGLTLLNHNRLLTLCPGCCGGKTGYTRAAGRCLVSCCERDGWRAVCVTLGDPDDWNDHIRLYDWAFGAYALHDLSAELRYTVPVVSGSRAAVRAAPAPGARAVLPQTGELRLEIELPRFVFAPVDAGEPAGSVRIAAGAGAELSCPLYYWESAVPADPCFSRRQ